MKSLSEMRLRETMAEINLPFDWLPQLRCSSRQASLVSMRKELARALYAKGYSFDQIGRLLAKDDTTIGYYVRGKK
jgi:hypothetical protein